MKQAADERNRRPWNNKGDRGLGDGPPRMRSGYGRQQQPPFANRGGGWNRGGAWDYEPPRGYGGRGYRPGYY